jgi:hypothetical protein
MSPRLFWKTSPRKFNALCKVHARLNGADKKKSASQSPEYKRTKAKAKQAIARQPETYIDKIM